jgi:hypothetical protein
MLEPFRFIPLTARCKSPSFRLYYRQSSSFARTPPRAGRECSVSPTIRPELRLHGREALTSRIEFPLVANRLVNMIDNQHLPNCGGGFQP